MSKQRVQRGRLTTHCSLLTTHYSLLTAYYSLLTAYYSLLTTHYSLLATRLVLLEVLHVAVVMHDVEERPVALRGVSGDPLGDLT